MHTCLLLGKNQDITSEVLWYLKMKKLSSRRPQQKSRHRNVRMMVEEGEDTEYTHEGTWASNVYESIDDDTDGRDPNNL